MTASRRQGFLHYQGCTVGFVVVVDVLVGDGCSFRVELRQDLRDEAGVDGVPEETVAFDVGKSV